MKNVSFNESYNPLELPFLLLSDEYTSVSLTMNSLGSPSSVKLSCILLYRHSLGRGNPDRAVSSRLILDPHFHGDDIRGLLLMAYRS